MVTLDHYCDVGKVYFWCVWVMLILHCFVLWGFILKGVVCVCQCVCVCVQSACSATRER